MSRKIPSYAKAFKDHSVLIFDENQSITSYPVYLVDGDTLEYEDGVLNLSTATKVYNNNNGGFTYVFNVPKMAAVEAKHLRELRRSKVIKNIMNYETDKSLDLGKLFPYVIAIVALIF